MKTICLYFEIHQIVHLKRYRFFDIGADHYYYDDYENERSIADIVDRSYMPALNTIGEMIKEHGDYFKVAFSLSGVGMEQLELHAPKVLDKLQELNQTGCVEFLAEPYSHGTLLAQGRAGLPRRGEVAGGEDQGVFRTGTEDLPQLGPHLQGRRSERSWPTWDSRDCSRRVRSTYWDGRVRTISTIARSTPTSSCS